MRIYISGSKIFSIYDGNAPRLSPSASIGVPGGVARGCVQVEVLRGSTTCFSFLTSMHLFVLYPARCCCIAVPADNAVRVWVVWFIVCPVGFSNCSFREGDVGGHMCATVCPVGVSEGEVFLQVWSQ